MEGMTSNFVSLAEIANIRTGLVLSRKQGLSTGDHAKKYPLLTLKSVNSLGYINREYVDWFYSEDHLDDDYFTKEGDVAIRLSEPNTAIFVDNNFTGHLIPSSFVIVRLKNKSILPEYLAWYLNSSFGKKQIERSHIGSAISIIKTSCLRNIIIKEISLKKQREIMGINNLFLKEKLLMQKFIVKKEAYYRHVMDIICEDNLNKKGA
jgi:restriction endonuclease S subunit